MVAEQHVLVGRNIVETVIVLPHRRGPAGRIRAQNATDDIERVEAERDQITGYGAATTSQRALIVSPRLRATTPSATAPTTAINIQMSHSPGERGILATADILVLPTELGPREGGPSGKSNHRPGQDMSVPAD